MTATGTVLAAEFQVAKLNALYTTRSKADPVEGRDYSRNSPTLMAKWTL